MPAEPTIATVLHEQAITYADKAALIYAADPLLESADVTLTYGQLDMAARRVAMLLREQVRPGDRAMLLYPPGLGFGVAFVGCLYADVIAVPVPLPAGAAQRDQRASGIAKDADVAVVLTESASLPAVIAWREAAGLDGLTCVATDTLTTDDPQWTVPAVAGTRPMMLQYTSGSTSDPKGVIICHDNMLSQVDMTRRVMAVGDHTRFGGWLPMHHDMGLIVQLVQPLLLGATSVVMSPFEFLKRPVRWLQLIQRHEVDVSLAPHFAYEVSARQVSPEQVATLDLRGWAVAGVGAEAVRAQTLVAFADRFRPAGFRAEALTVGYGLAEATVYVSVGRRAEAPNVVAVDSERLEDNEFVPADGQPQQIVSCGWPCEMEVIVVDPATRGRASDGRVGEVWVRGTGVALGYWGNEQATTDTFRGTLDTGETGYLRTGDLGTVHHGEVYITGRLKDLLIVRGRNLHPQDIEYEVRGLHEALATRYGAVFAVPGSGLSTVEQVIVVQECAADLDIDAYKAITGLVKDWSAQELGFRVAGVVLLKPGGVSRTSSGKVQRALMREHFMTGSLDALYEELTPELRRQYRREAADGRLAARPA